MDGQNTTILGAASGSKCERFSTKLIMYVRHDDASVEKTVVLCGYVHEAPKQIYHKEQKPLERTQKWKNSNRILYVLLLAMDTAVCMVI